MLFHSVGPTGHPLDPDLLILGHGFCLADRMVFNNANSETVLYVGDVNCI